MSLHGDVRTLPAPIHAATKKEVDLVHCRAEVFEIAQGGSAGASLARRNVEHDALDQRISAWPIYAQMPKSSSSSNTAQTQPLCQSVGLCAFKSKTKDLKAKLDVTLALPPMLRTLTIAALALCASSFAPATPNRVSRGVAAKASVFDYTMDDAEGNSVALASFESKKALLIVNLASE